MRPMTTRSLTRRSVLGLLTASALTGVTACAAGGPPTSEPADGTTGGSTHPSSAGGVSGSAGPSARAGLPTAKPNLFKSVDQVANLQLTDEVQVEEATATYVAPLGLVKQTRAAKVAAVPFSMLTPEDLAAALPSDSPSPEPTALVKPAEGQHFIVFTLSVTTDQPQGEAQWLDGLKGQVEQMASTEVTAALVTEASSAFPLPSSGEQTWVLSVKDGVTPKLTFTVDKNVQTLLVEKGALDADGAPSLFRLKDGLAQSLSKTGPTTTLALANREGEKAVYTPVLGTVTVSTWDPVKGFAPAGQKWVQVSGTSTGNTALHGNTYAYELSYDKWAMTVNQAPQPRAYVVPVVDGLGKWEKVYATFLAPLAATKATLSMTSTLTLDPGKPPAPQADSQPFTLDVTLP